jgi:hypothetical protein
MGGRDRRINVQGQLCKKVGETLSQKNKTDVVVHACNPS